MVPRHDVRWQETSDALSEPRKNTMPCGGYPFGMFRRAAPRVAHLREIKCALLFYGGGSGRKVKNG